MFNAEELKALAKADAEVNKMKTKAELENDLTDAQKEEVKKNRASKGPTVYKFNSKREKKEKPEKKEIINDLIGACGGSDIQILNDEREFTFVRGGVKYKITLAVPRS